MLLDHYAKHGTLPGGQTRLYQEGCRLMCGEISDTRLEMGRHADADRRYAISMRIAAGTVFCNRTGIDVAPDPVNAPPTDVSAALLAGGKEKVLENDVEVTEAIVRDALAGGLFERRGDRRRVFGHRTYSEYLAAAYVVARQMPLQQIRELIFGSDNRVIPQLYETAAWLAGMVPALIDEIAAADPRLLLQSNVALAAPADREKVVASLLIHFDRKEGGDFDGSLRELLPRLKHPKLTEQLLPFITSKAKSESARQTAIDLARECNVANTAEALAALALDKAEKPWLRARAARAYRALHPRDELDKLGPLLLLPPEEDPADDLKAVALLSRWPGRMTASELFAALNRPRQHTIGGRYWGFLHSPFADHLKREDLSVALAWVRDNPTLKDPSHLLAHPVAAILERAWRDVSDMAVMDAFADAALAVLTRHEPLARPAKGAKYERLVDIDDANRPVLVERLVELAAKTAASPARLVHGQTPVAFAKDVPWMLDRLRAAAPAEQAVWAALIRGVFSPRDAASETHIDAILTTAELVPVLREQFSYYIDSVAIDSAYAEQEREILRDERERKRRETERHPPLDPPPAVRLDEALKRSEAGDPVAWLGVWEESELMANEVGKPIYLDSVDLTKSPGWQGADEATRDRVIAAARRYLEFPHPDAATWLEGPGVTHGLTGAYRAIRLLFETRRTELEDWPKELWERWAASLVRSTSSGPEEDLRAQQEIVGLAYKQIAEELIRRLALRIDAENEARNFTHPHERFALCWDERLRTILEAKLRDDLYPAAFRGLLKDLLARGSSAARAYAEGLLRPPLPTNGEARERALAAAAVLVQHTDDAAWPAVWPAVSSDTPFGKQLFEDLAGRMWGIKADLGARLREKQAGELFEWLSKQFPHEDDPDRHEVGAAMSPRETVGRFRNAIMGDLRDRGTPAALEAIRHAIRELPHLNWLGPTLIQAQEQARRKSWEPLTPRDLLTLAENTEKRFVSSEAQLRDVVLDSLERLQIRLIDAGTMLFVWDNVKDQGTKKPAPAGAPATASGGAPADRPAGGDETEPPPGPMPADEAKLRLLIKDHLDQDLRARGILLNQEVEIRPGEFLDIHVNVALRGVPGARAAVVIEVKGCWNKDLKESMEKQLRDRYLQGASSSHGIYLVGWFLCERWDKRDYRRGKTPKWTLEKAREFFRDQAKKLAIDGIALDAVTLDLALR